METISKIRIRSENIFDKNNADKKDWYLNDGIPTFSSSFKSIVLPCSVSTEYTIQRFKNKTAPFGIAFYDNYPDIDSIPTSYLRSGSVDILTLKSTTNSRYLVCEYIYTNDATGAEEQEVIDSLVVSKGKGILEYMPYFLESTNIKNNNVSKLNFNNVEYDFAKTTNPEQPEEPVEPQVLYTVVIDKANTDYFARCTYADDAVDFLPATNTGSVYSSNGWDARFPFNKMKPCVLRDGELVGYLNPNDYTVYEDGTAVNSDAENEFLDVMVEIPKVYYQVESNDTTIYIRISDKKINDNFKCYAHVYDGEELDKIYIAAYDCGYKLYNDKNTVFSYTNTLPNCQDVVTNLNYQTLLDNKNERYRMLNYDQTVLLQCLFVLMFKSTGSEWSFAKGNKKRLGELNASGLCDQKGMYYGSVSVETESCKLFGIENIYGNIYTRVEGVAIHGMNDSGTYEFRRRDPYSKVPINNLGEGYEIYTNPELDGYYKTEFYLSNPYATTELGFLPKSYRYDDTVSTTYNKYYCDTVFIRSSYGLWFGGDYKAYSYGGMFHYYHDLGSEITNKNLGYKIVYYPIGG